MAVDVRARSGWPLQFSVVSELLLFLSLFLILFCSLGWPFMFPGEQPEDDEENPNGRIPLFPVSHIPASGLTRLCR